MAFLPFILNKLKIEYSSTFLEINIRKHDSTEKNRNQAGDFRPL